METGFKARSYEGARWATAPKLQFFPNKFDNFLTPFATNIPQNVTSGVETENVMLASLTALFCTQIQNGGAARHHEG